MWFITSFILVYLHYCIWAIIFITPWPLCQYRLSLFLEIKSLVVSLLGSYHSGKAGEQCTVVFALIITEPASECVLHRVGRVLSVSPVVGIGTPPPLSQPASVPPPPFGTGGEGTLACG